MWKIMKKLFHLFSFLFQNIKWKTRPLAVLTLSGMSQMPLVLSRYSNKVSQQPKEMVPAPLPCFVFPEQSKANLSFEHFTSPAKQSFSPLKLYLLKWTNLSRKNTNTLSWNTLSPKDYNILDKVLTKITSLYLSYVSPFNFSFLLFLN